MSRMAGHQHTDEARASTRKLTYADFLDFPDDGQRHELIAGEHYVAPSPNLWHQELSKRLMFALESHLRQHGGGRLFYAPLDRVFTDFDIVEPDLLMVTTDQFHILTEKHVNGAPALVVEILSKSTRNVDERVKRDLYDRAGVCEYWTVDPKGKRITVYARYGDRLERRHELFAEHHDTLSTPLLPRFALSLAEYFQ